MRVALGFLLTVLLALPAKGRGDPSYEVTVNSPHRLEIRFHGLPVQSVHADDSQSALGIDFLEAVDGAPFDRLPHELPLWIAMAYTNFDNGVIRGTRPVSFLVRPDDDGFVLRVIPRGRGEPTVARADPPPIRGSFAGS